MRKEIKNEDLDDQEETLVNDMKELSDRDVIRKINPPRAGSTKGQNMFKGYLED